MAALSTLVFSVVNPTIWMEACASCLLFKIVCVDMLLLVTVYVWGLEDNVSESVLSVYMGSRSRTQLSGFCCKHLYPLSHLTSPIQDSFYVDHQAQGAEGIPE